MTMRARVLGYIVQSGIAALHDGTHAMAGSVIETGTHIRPSPHPPAPAQGVMHEPPMHASPPQLAGAPQVMYSRPAAPVSGTGPVSGRGPESTGAVA
jgi:hypothetical protein